jgi:hypothetical protein
MLAKHCARPCQAQLVQCSALVCSPLFQRQVMPKIKGNGQQLSFILQKDTVRRRQEMMRKDICGSDFLHRNSQRTATD